ncbi:MAG: CPBP family intramembrane metalloprotease [Lachnospiraceae bacterium]|nr:CPBP family intramembrane metalloprotease [Lachnospiraceae bacterium]
MKVKHANFYFLLVLAVFLVESFLFYFFQDIPIWLEEGARDLLLILIAFLYLKADKVSVRDGIGFRRIRWSTLGWVALITFMVQPLSSTFYELSTRFSPDFLADAEDMLFTDNFFIDAFTVAALPGFFEEFVFRGVLHHSYLRSGRKLVPVIVLTALEFGLFHMNFTQFSYAFILGIILSFVMESAGSIWASMFMHFLNNFFSVFENMVFEWNSDVAQFLPLQYLNYDTKEAGILTFALTLICTPLVFVVCRKISANEYRTIDYRRQVRGEILVREEDLVLEKNGKKQRIFTFSLILALVICLGMCVFMHFALSMTGTPAPAEEVPAALPGFVKWL